MGRVRTLTYPDTEVVTYTYNGFGDVETIAGVKSAVSTDYIKEVNYNASGQITYTKYGNNVTSDYTYNSNTLRLSNILTKKPDGTTKLQDLSYTFDNNGNVATIADTVNSMSQTFAYDDLNRLTQAVGSAYGTQNFAYNSIGNMTTKANLTMSYGTSGSPTRPHAVTSVTTNSGTAPTFCRDLVNPSSCTMIYDNNGNMTQRGEDILTYDSENRLKEMKAYEGTTGTQSYTLKPGWNVVSFPYLPEDKSITAVISGLTFETDYDQVSTWDAEGGAWKHFVNDADFNDFSTFEYGKTYEIYNKTGVDKTFAVTSERSVGPDITRTLIASGDNFVSPAVKTATNVTTVLASLTSGTHWSNVKRYNATSLTWESYNAGAFTQFEPGKGYIIVGGSSNASFSYGKNETTTTFVYDSTGARVKKTAASTTTVYLGKDYDVTGSLSTKYVFLGDRRIASKDSSNVKLYFHEDHINSSNVITDSSGNQAALYEYDPYGLTATHTGATDVKHQFTGQEKDDSTGLHYYNARYYDSQLGRFITADPTVQHPSDPQDFNRYAYARNNPIRFTDPTGLSWFSQLIGAIAGLVATYFAGPIVGFATYAAINSLISSREKGASWGRAIAASSISFGVSIAGAYILGPLASSIGGAIGSAVGSQVGSVAGSTIGSYAGAAASGAAQGAIYGGFSGGVTTAIYGGNLKQIGSGALQGAYTGAIYGVITGPIPLMVKDLGKAVPTVANQFRKFMDEIGLSSQEGSAQISRGGGKDFDGIPGAGNMVSKQFQTSQGSVDVFAEAIIDGKTLILKDIGVFPTKGGQLNIGAKEVLGIKNELANAARAKGFETLKITGQRISGANPGKKIDITINLRDNS